MDIPCESLITVATILICRMTPDVQKNTTPFVKLEENWGNMIVLFPGIPYIIRRQKMQLDSLSMVLPVSTWFIVKLFLYIDIRTRDSFQFHLDFLVCYNVVCSRVIKLLLQKQLWDDRFFSMIKIQHLRVIVVSTILIS